MIKQEIEQASRDIKINLIKMDKIKDNSWRIKLNRKRNSSKIKINKLSFEIAFYIHSSDIG